MQPLMTLSLESGMYAMVEPRRGRRRWLLLLVHTYFDNGNAVWQMPVCVSGCREGGGGARLKGRCEALERSSTLALDPSPRRRGGGGMAGRRNTGRRNTGQRDGARAAKYGTAGRRDGGTGGGGGGRRRRLLLCWFCGCFGRAIVWSGRCVGVSA